MMEVLNKTYSAPKNSIGLSQSEAEKRLKENGPNALHKEKKKKPLKIFLGQFKDIMVIILLIATVISVLLGEVYDALTIILIVLLDAVLGFIQEFRTEKTLEMLNRMTAPTARCYRDGDLKTIPAETLVKGDIIEVEAGDKIPADCFIINSKGLFCDESILTGETVPAEKISSVSSSPDNSLGRKDVVYSGTIVTKGHSRAKVIATALESQVGKISEMIGEIEDEQTPLQKRLGELGKVIAIICVVICFIVFTAGVLRGEPVFNMLLTGISIAIAAIPEGLPAAVTIALALAVSRMLKQRALVNKLHSVETLGCASVICSDKTGTITENKMTVTKISTHNNTYDVIGNGYKIAGEILQNKMRINPMQDKVLSEILISSVLCNNAEIKTNEDISSRQRGKVTANGEWTVNGDPTEIALLVSAAKAGITASDLSRSYRKIDEIPFDSDTKCMTVTVSKNSGERISYTKGALDIILNQCDFIATSKGTIPLGYSVKHRILEENDRLADDALRVLAFSKKELGGGMVFLGLIGMTDPPRPEAKEAIKLCARANIKTVMITGDHKNTAVAIARQAGIIKGSADGRVMTGVELDEISEDRLASIIENIRVFARVTPDHKLKIVRAFKKKGNIVTMTGDGVNDAPAIKEADIGVSMGITGTDVAKQAADIILLDDNFATLVNAVKQGRTIYSNIRKFVRYLLSCNIGEVITMFAGILIGLPPVLVPTQILLVNLVTDGLPAIALGVEPVDESLMNKKPRSPKESFFSDGLMGKIVIRGILIGVCTLGCFSVLFKMSGENLCVAQTGALFTLVMSQLLHVFECKSEVKNIFTVPYFNNKKLILAVLFSLLIILAAIFVPAMQVVFSTVALTNIQLGIAMAFSAAIPVISAFLSVFRKK